MQKQTQISFKHNPCRPLFGITQQVYVGLKDILLRWLFVQKIRVAKTRASVNRRCVIILERLSSKGDAGDSSHAGCITNDLDESSSSRKPFDKQDRQANWTNAFLIAA